jgi:hypothetical protein
LGELEPFFHFDFRIADAIEDVAQKCPNISLVNPITDPLVRGERPGPRRISSFKKNVAGQGIKIF